MGAAARRPPHQQPLLDAGHIDTVLDWYRDNSRDLPWRAPDRTPWGVLVCEVMSQQTPVARIIDPWRDWLARWPTPGDLAAASPGDAIRMWGRLGYPRRALRLHAAATAMVERHGGEVPGSVAELLALPGIGAYTAAATAAFGFGVRTTVLDVNIRRVIARVADVRAGGDAGPPAGAPTRTEVARAAALLPTDPARAATWNAAVMELGALICTARAPRCPSCPLVDSCGTAAHARVRAVDHGAVDDRGAVSNHGTANYGGDGTGTAGSTLAGVTTRTSRSQPWVGTDRYVRGLVMARLREAEAGVARADLDLVWSDGGQLGRCVDSLVADGLAVATDQRIGLPGPLAAARL